jgi:hypothetical protein
LIKTHKKEKTRSNNLKKLTKKSCKRSLWALSREKNNSYSFVTSIVRRLVNSSTSLKPTGDQPKKAKQSSKWKKELEETCTS